MCWAPEPLWQALSSSSPDRDIQDQGTTLLVPRDLPVTNQLWPLVGANGSGLVVRPRPRVPLPMSLTVPRAIRKEGMLNTTAAFFPSCGMLPFPISLAKSQGARQMLLWLCMRREAEGRLRKAFSFHSHPPKRVSHLIDFMGFCFCSPASTRGAEQGWMQHGQQDQPLPAARLEPAETSQKKPWWLLFKNVAFLSQICSLLGYKNICASKRREVLWG